MQKRVPLDPLVPTIEHERAERYHRAGWWTTDPVGASIWRRCVDGAERCAVVDGERRVSYGELGTSAAALVEGLRNAGISPGDRVGLQTTNCVEFVTYLLALLRIGAPAVPILPAFREHELDHIVAATEMTAMVVEVSGRDGERETTARRLQVRHACLRRLFVFGRGAGDEEELTVPDRPEPPVMPPPPPVDVHDAAVFLLSSGTTGLPKPIARSHGGYGYMIRQALEVTGVNADSVNLAVLPIQHGFTLNCPGVIGTLSVGGRVVMSNANNTRSSLQLVENECVTHTTLVPALARSWVTQARCGTYDLSSLRTVLVGGSRLTAESAADMREVLGVRPQQAYGMSEGLIAFTRPRDPDRVAFETQGRPVSPGDEIKVLDGAGKEVRRGETGELCTRGPYTVPAYYRSPEATSTAFTEDGYYRTGDLVRLDPGDNIIVEGRVRDAINRAGEKISAEELESFARRHPAILDAAGVAMPHRHLGEVACLYVVLDPAVDDAEPVTLRSLRHFLVDRGLALFKLPEHMVAVDRFPVTSIGKTDKSALRRDAESRAT